MILRQVSRFSMYRQYTFRLISGETFKYTIREFPEATVFYCKIKD